MKCLRKIPWFFLLVWIFVASSQETLSQTVADNDPLATAEGVVTEIYSLVSFEGGKTPDWDLVKSIFLGQAIVVLRTSREETTVFTVDGFVQDFVNFVEQSPAGQMGFTETIIRLEPLVFGDMAHILVLYEAQITGSERPPT